MRELTVKHGVFIEIHVATSPEVCEACDRKGLYRRCANVVRLFANDAQFNVAWMKRSGIRGPRRQPGPRHPSVPASVAPIIHHHALSVLGTLRLESSLLWPIPVTLDVPEAAAEHLATADRFALQGPDGFTHALLTGSDAWGLDQRREAQAIYGTTGGGRIAAQVGRALARRRCMRHRRARVEPNGVGGASPALPKNR